MCVVAAKYLPKYGWVGVKNRDRNYKPTLGFKQSFKNNVESLYLLDNLTYYSEGINEYGLCIINAATAVKNDESEAAAARRHAKKEAKQNGEYRAPDGIKIRKALKYKTPKEAIEFLSKVKLKGNTICFNQEECYLMELGPDKEQLNMQKDIAKDNPNYEWTPIDSVFKIKKIDKKDIILRTNHGNFLPWAGYQEDPKDAKMSFSRESSVKRYEYALKNIKLANTPEEMLEAISKIEDKNSQFNPTRIGDYNNRTKLKTTGQLLLISKLREFTYRPIWGNVNLNNINKLNSNKSNTYLRLMPFNNRLSESTNLFKDIDKYLK